MHQHFLPGLPKKPFLDHPFCGLTHVGVFSADSPIKKDFRSRINNASVSSDFISGLSPLWPSLACPNFSQAMSQSNFCIYSSPSTYTYLNGVRNYRWLLCLSGRRPCALGFLQLPVFKPSKLSWREPASSRSFSRLQGCYLRPLNSLAQTVTTRHGCDSLQQL